MGKLLGFADGEWVPCFGVMVMWSLVGRIVDVLFDQVASLVGKQDIRSVLSRLVMWQEAAVFVIKQNDVGALEEMKRFCQN